MIRSIAPGDEQAVAAICAEALGHAAAADHIAKRISELACQPSYFIAVYEDDANHEVRGFMQAQRYDLLYGDNGWNIIALAVLPAWQGMGAGTQLLAALENRARAAGDGFIRLNSRVERTDAHAFYAHRGYRCDKLQKRLIKQLKDQD